MRTILAVLATVALCGCAVPRTETDGSVVTVTEGDGFEALSARTGDYCRVWREGQELALSGHIVTVNRDWFVLKDEQSNEHIWLPTGDIQTIRFNADEQAASAAETEEQQVSASSLVGTWKNTGSADRLVYTEKGIWEAIWCFWRGGRR